MVRASSGFATKLKYLILCGVAWMALASSSFAAVYAVTGGGGPSARSLFTLDVSSGDVTLVGEVGYPMTGLVATSDGALLAYTPDTTNCGDWECHEPAILHLNPADGSVTALEPVDLSGTITEDTQIQDLAIHPITGRVFAVGYYGVFGELLGIGSGSVTYQPIDILETSDFFSCGAAEFAPNNSDVLLCTDWCESEFSPSSGLHALQTNGYYLGSIATTNSLIGMGAVNGQMYGHVYRGGCGGLGPDNQGDFVVLDVDTGVQTVIKSGANVPYIHDIAFPNVLAPPTPESVPVPALPAYLLVALSGLLAVFGFVRTRASS